MNKCVFPCLEANFVDKFGQVMPVSRHQTPHGNGLNSIISRLPSSTDYIRIDSKGFCIQEKEIFGFPFLFLSEVYNLKLELKFI